MALGDTSEGSYPSGKCASKERKGGERVMSSNAASDPSFPAPETIGGGSTTDISAEPFAGLQDTDADLPTSSAVGSSTSYDNHDANDLRSVFMSMFGDHGYPSDGSVVTVLVDSGASGHLASDLVTEDQYISKSGSAIQIKSASGHTVDASMDVHTSVQFGRDGNHVLRMHVISTNETWLFSMDKLASLGFDFHLTNQPHHESYMEVVATGRRIILRRQFPEKNCGFWYLDLAFAGPRGCARVLNAIEHHEDSDVFTLTDAGGKSDVNMPHKALLSKDEQNRTSIDDARSGEIPLVIDPRDLQQQLLIGSLTADVALQSQLWKGRRTTDGVISDEQAKMLFGDIIPRLDARIQRMAMATNHVRTDTLGCPQADAQNATREHGEPAQHKAAADTNPSHALENRASHSSPDSRIAGPRAVPAQSAAAPTAVSEQGPGKKEAEDNTTRRRGKKRTLRPRTHDTNGEALHASLAHPTRKKTDRWERCADGFPRRMQHSARCTCWACHSGSLRRRSTTKVPKGENNSKDTVATHWHFDISRRWEPDLWGYTGFVLFVDDASAFVCVYPITDHTEFWDKAVEHVKYVKAHFKVSIETISSDYDPIWSNATAHAWVGPNTEGAKWFEFEYSINIHRSPPHTHNLNAAEPFMGRMVAMANHQLIYAHLAPRAFWWAAISHSATIHNVGPIETRTRPLLFGDTTPFEVMTGKRATVAHLIAPFGALCWVKVMTTSSSSTHGIKPSQLKPMSEPALYLGPARGSAGWSVLRLSQVGNRNPVATVSYHVTPIPDMTQRPAILMKHDSLIAETPLSSGPLLFNESIRSLFEDSTNVDKQLIKFSELTGQPVALMPMIDPTDQATLLLPPDQEDPEHQDTPTPKSATPEQDGARRRRSRARHRPTEAKTSGTDEGPPQAATKAKSREGQDETSDGRQAEATPTVRRDFRLGNQRLEHDARVRLGKLPRDTRIEISQENPYAPHSRVWRRFQKYKSSTTLGQFYDLGGGKRTDLPRDFSKNLIKIPESAADVIVDPIMSILANANVEDIKPKIHERATRDHLNNALIMGMELKSKETPRAQDPDYGQPANGHDYDRYLEDTEALRREVDENYEEPKPMLSPARASLNPEASEYRPDTTKLADAACTTQRPGGVCMAAEGVETSNSGNHTNTSLGPGGVRGAVAEAAATKRTGKDPLATAEQINLKYTTNIDAALRALTPTDVPIDSSAELILHAIDGDLFKGVEPDDTLRDPTSYGDYKSAPDRLQFRASMFEEAYQLLDKYQTLDHATIDDVRKAKAAGRTVRIVPSKIVYKRKLNKDGSVDRWKSRWCACEAKGRFTVENTYSPAISIESVRILMVIAAVNDMDISTVDVSGAYLVGDRPDDEDVIFLRMPPGLSDVQEERIARGLPHDPRLEYADNRGRPKYYRVAHNLYGLQSAGAVFYRHAKAWLIQELGFTPSSVDPCIFHRRTDRGLTIIGLYVDDMIVLTPNPDLKAEFMNAFSIKFDQSPEGADESFLSINYRREGRRIHLNTPKLWKSLKTLTNGQTLPRARGAPLPPEALALLALGESKDNPIIDQAECDVRAILGTAMWGVYAVRPAEAFAVAAIARHAHRPTKNVRDVLLHLCAYLLAHADDELTIDPDKNKTPVTFVDSSWGNDPSTMRSFYGYCIMWAGCPMSFRSKLEPCVTLSSRDAEALGACFAIKAMLAIMIIFSELGLSEESRFILKVPDEQLGPPWPLYVDNQPVVDNANSDRLHRDSRHNALRIAWIREMVSNSLVSVRKIATSANVSDAFTKVLTPAEHQRFRAVLMGSATVETLGFIMCVCGT